MRRVTLISRMPEEPLIANVDADLLKQAALNVIQNGAQAMPDGGRLEVTLEEDRESRTSFAAPGSEATGRRRRRRASGANSPCCALPTRASEFPTKIRDKIFDLYFHNQDRGQRHRTGHDLPHPAVTPRERGSTIEARPRHGIPAANSTRRRGPGTPESATGEH
jgi:signal transduction histidine kinase